MGISPCLLVRFCILVCLKNSLFKKVFRFFHVGKYQVGAFVGKGFVWQRTGVDGHGEDAGGYGGPHSQWRVLYHYAFTWLYAGFCEAFDVRFRVRFATAYVSCGNDKPTVNETGKILFKSFQQTALTAACDYDYLLSAVLYHAH